MRRYECLYVLKPDLPPEEVDSLCQKFTDIISRMGGQLLLEDRWGIKTLAYEVKKYSKGYYVLLDFAGDPSISRELERNFKMHENVIRFLTLVTDKSFTPEKMESLSKPQGEEQETKGKGEAQTAEEPGTEEEEDKAAQASPQPGEGDKE